MSTPTIAQKGPYVLEVEPGTYAWCACGRSTTQPYCSGAHQGTEFSPIVVEITEKKTVYWCGCKQSKNKPYCDGSHRKL